MGYGLKTYLILFGGVLALSTSAIFAKVAEAPSGVLAFWRLFLAALVLAPFFFGSRTARTEARKLSGWQWRQILLAGAFLALHYVLWFESLRFTSVASSTVIVCLQPLFALALEHFLDGRALRPSALAGCAIALAGCVVISAGDLAFSGRAFFGDVLAFVAAGVIAAYFYVGGKIRQTVSAVTYSTLGYFASAVFLGVYTLLAGMAFTGYPARTWWAFIGIALISTIGGQFVFNLLLKRVPASAVTMSILGEPVGTILLAWLFLGEGLTPGQGVGIFVIMAGMVVFFRPPRKPRTIKSDHV